jgi:hypothetical protein
MTTTYESRYRILIDVTPTKARRLRIQKRDRRRKYVDLDHPRSHEDIRAIQMARKMLNLAGQGISDTDDIIAIANKPRPSRRRRTRKPPAGRGLFSEDAFAVAASH